MSDPWETGFGCFAVLVALCVLSGMFAWLVVFPAIGLLFLLGFLT